MKTRSVLVLTGFLAVAGCSKDASVTSTTTGPTPSERTTSLYGTIVQIIDSIGNTRSDLRGVTISLDGTNYTTTTDSLGFWKITSMPVGFYNVTVSLPGFQSVSYTRLPIVEGASNYLGVTSLLQSILFHVTLDALYMPSQNQYGKLAGHYSNGHPASIRSSLYFILSHTTNPDIADRTSYLSGVSENIDNDTTSGFSMVLANNSLFNNFKIGDTVYLRAYPYFDHYNYNFTDVPHGYGQASNILGGVLKQ